MESLQTHLQQLSAALNRVLCGKPEVVELGLTTLLAGGHLLLEDLPGVGKTTFGSALARCIGGTFSRIQFTADLLPADVLGCRVFYRSQEKFELVRGPIFANLILADELNRPPPKTQSALLQAMSEGRVSIDRETLELPNPFMVVATQNPRWHQGTYPLPESQRDRFLMRLSIGYPPPAVEMTILQERRLTDPLLHLQPIMSLETVIKAKDAAQQIPVPPPVLQYICRLAEATRVHSDVAIPVSPRATLALMRAAQALALLRRLDVVDIDLIKFLAPRVFGHRISLKTPISALVEDSSQTQWVERELLTRVSVE